VQWGLTVRAAPRLPVQGAYITFGGKRLMAVTPGQGVVVDPSGDFSASDPDSDVWRMLPIPSSERGHCRP
jgi:hypothetical protein